MAASFDCTQWVVHLTDLIRKQETSLIQNYVYEWPREIGSRILRTITTSNVFFCLFVAIWH